MWRWFREMRVCRTAGRQAICASRTARAPGWRRWDSALTSRSVTRLFSPRLFECVLCAQGTSRVSVDTEIFDMLCHSATAAHRWSVFYNSVWSSINHHDIRTDMHTKEENVCRYSGSTTFCIRHILLHCRAPSFHLPFERHQTVYTFSFSGCSTRYPRI